MHTAAMQVHLEGFRTGDGSIRAAMYLMVVQSRYSGAIVSALLSKIGMLPFSRRTDYLALLADA